MSFITHNDKLVVAPNGKALSVSSGASLNIAYGLTAPEDTSKIWVKIQNEPEKVLLRNNFTRLGDEYITSLNSLPDSVKENQATRIGDDIYVLSETSTNKFYKYNITSNTVSDVIFTPGFSGVPSGVAMDTYEGKLYLFGGTYGNTYIGDIYIFDPATQIMTRSNISLPDTRAYAKCIAIGSKIYIFGGYISNSSVTGSILIYDAVNDTIANSGKSGNRVRYQLTNMNGKIYQIGGYISSEAKSLTKYDPENDVVNTYTSVFSRDMYVAGVCEIGNYIYIFGGGDGPGAYLRSYYNTIFRLDPNTRAVTTLDITLPYSNGAMSVVPYGSKCFIIGGYTSNGILSFTDRVSVPFNTLMFINGYSDQKVKIIDSDNAEIESTIKLALLGDENGEGHPVEVYQYINSEWTKIV